MTDRDTQEAGKGMHTPTPWHLDKCGREEHEVEIKQSPGGWFLVIGAGYPFEKMAYPDDARAEFEANAQLIVTAVNSHSTLTAENARLLQENKAMREALTPGADEAFDALDLADNLIERAYGTDVPVEWNRAIKKVARARAALTTTNDGGGE